MRGMRALGQFRPELQFGIRLPMTRPGEWRQVLPFRKSWTAIGFLTVFAIAFTIPLFLVSGFASGGSDSLSGLSINFFVLFWALGWSVAVISLWGLVLIMLLGREVIIVSSAAVILRLEILCIGLAASYPADRISRLRAVQEKSASSGNKWRGQHLSFHYYNVPVCFGSGLNDQAVTNLFAQITNRLGALPQKFVEPPPAMTASVLPPVKEIKKQEVVASTGAEYSRSSQIALLFSNTVPLLGVLFFGWSVGELMLLFWLESAVIGVYNVIKMALIAKWLAIFIAVFFVGHYGAFMAGHLLFIFNFFIATPDQETPSSADVWQMIYSLWPAVLAMVISHGFSFRQHFLGRREYAGRTLQQQMAEPYKRIVVMHLTIIFGGFLVMSLGAPIGALVLLIMLKAVVDLKAHIKEHHPGRELKSISTEQ